MKKINWLMMLMTAALLSFVACNDDPTPDNPPVDNPDDPADTELTIALEVLETTRNTMTYNATPSDVEADYALLVYPAASVEQCATDELLVDKLYKEIEAAATIENTTFEELMANSIVRKGAVEGGAFDNLSAGMGYYLLAFGVDAADGYKATSDVAKAKFTTEAMPSGSACTFEIKAEVYCNSASLDVTPSDLSQEWHLVNVPVDTLSTYTDEEGEYAFTLEQFFEHHLLSEIEELGGKGLSAEQIELKLYHTGAKTLSVSNLTPKTKYVALAAAVEYDSDGVVVTSQVSQVRYNVGEAAASDLAFEVEVRNVEHYAADIRITPSNLDVEYYYTILPYDGKSKDAKAVDLVTKYVNEQLYYWGDDGKLAHRAGVKGVQDFTGENKYQLNVAEMEYYILVFSYELNPSYGTLIDEENGIFDENPGALASAPALVTFTTLEQGDPLSAEFTFKASDVGPYGFSMEIETNDPTVYYMPGVAVAGTFDESALIAQYSGFLNTQMQLYQIAEPGISNHRALEEWGSNYFRNGSGKYGIKNLTPDTEYIGYVLIIDADQGIFVRGIASEVIAKTTTAGTVNPGLELLGIYDGNQENGELFGNADATAGCPIIAVKHTNIEGATALYGAISQGDDLGENGKPVSDQYIIAQFHGYWSEIGLAVPYNFYVAEWDVDQMIVAYAKDASGREGKVARLFIKDWTTTNDIAELKGYVEEVNAAAKPSASKLSASRVYAEVEDILPTVEPIGNEKVGSKAEAEVIYRTVEPKAVAGDVVVVSAIRVVRF